MPMTMAVAAQDITATQWPIVVALSQECSSSQGITTLGEISPVLPPVSFGATSVLAGMAVACFLTETRNVPLVETIAAMERR